MSQCILEQDRNAAYPAFSIGGVNKKTNLCGGVLGILFWILLIILIIQKSISVFGKRQVQVETAILRDQSKIQIDTMQGFSVLVCQLFKDGCEPIKADKQYSYGFQVIVIEYYSWVNYTDGKAHNDVQIRPMVSCKQNNSFYCLPEQFQIINLECQLQKLAPYPIGCNQTRFYDIMIRSCYPEKQGCVQNIFTDITASFFFLSQKFKVFEPNTEEILQPQFKVIFSSVIFDESNQYVYEVMFSKLIIESDESIFPTILYKSQPNVLNTWFYPEQLSQFIDFYPYPHHRFLTFQLRRSYNTEQYRRSFQKIDAMLGKFLGFMGLIGWIIGIFCIGYNQFLLDNQIRNKKQDADLKVQTKQQIEKDEPQIKRNPHIFDYIKHSIKSIPSLFCKNNTQASQTTIDILDLYKKVERLEKQLLEMKSQKSLPQQRQQPPQKKELNIKINLEDSLQESLLTQKSENKKE